MLWKQSLYPFLLAPLECSLLSSGSNPLSEDKSAIEAGRCGKPFPAAPLGIPESCWQRCPAQSGSAVAGGAWQDGSRLREGSEGQQLALVPVPRVSLGTEGQDWALHCTPCPGLSPGCGDLTTHTRPRVLLPLSHSCLHFVPVSSGQGWVVVFFPKIALLQNLLVVEKLLCLALVWVYLLVFCSEIAGARTSPCWQRLVE